MLLSALLLTLALHAQALTADSPELRISQEEFRKLYESGEVVVIDVRGPQAYANGHIAGARSIPLNTVEKGLSELKKEKRPIVTYCS